MSQSNQSPLFFLLKRRKMKEKKARSKNKISFTMDSIDCVKKCCEHCHWLTPIDFEIDDNFSEQNDTLMKMVIKRQFFFFFFFFLLSYLHRLCHHHLHPDQLVCIWLLEQMLPWNVLSQNRFLFWTAACNMFVNERQI